MAKRRRVVVAFGGNALIRRGEEGTQTEQIENSERLARRLVALVGERDELLLVHGNGPQVGTILIQVEEAVTKVPPVSLDLCVAQSQGSIGYLLERSLVNRLRARGTRREVVSLISQVVVERSDPGFRKPSKPIGPFYTRYRAEYLAKRQGWLMVEDSGRGYRKLVPSPRPREVLCLGAIADALKRGCIVIAGGGGGVPVYRDERGVLRGVEAVIDKDRTAGLLATELKADLFVILTAVDRVYLNFGRPDQLPVDRLSVSDVRRHLRDGQFPAGSMGPKMETAADFVEATGREVVITSVEKVKEALSGKSGTRIIPDARGRGRNS
ncbi:MAG TPA: carbamate kinase [Candidatus Polarisedimenticolia bacterium]|nr:carbamate kinase [Candidatus Polarisedimenticolia bacterium]